ncbi:GrpB family protein [Tolypothrix sp. FACHB-123]|uniref:GrpB family protein n=1 Tax=Tolypothrix sp. FACHB-123 TaxID=2692868 RepID=UPI001688DF1A|nr:GrpB family protein [Tolypothrix sp. FACHB-123]MBD2353028.1 GrpB family protein [Tolypothrix sp. FACHB-123]
MKVEVVPHDSTWRSQFEDEAKLIALAFGDNVIDIQHIGSTAIPTIYAKPIIDILVQVKDIAKVDEQSSAMTALGYEIMGEFGIAGRRFFRKHNDQGIRTHHVHIFQINVSEVQRHLAFRDYMIAHPEDALKYSDLKRGLAKQYPEDMEGYVNGKDGFIKEMERKAIAWIRSVRLP